MRVHRVLLARLGFLHSAVVVGRVDRVAVRGVVLAPEVLLGDSKWFPFLRVLVVLWHGVYIRHIIFLDLLH